MAPKQQPGQTKLQQKMSSDVRSSSSDTLSDAFVTLPPDGGYGWVVVAACFLISVMNDGCLNSFGWYQLDVGKEFDKGTAQVAILPSLCAGFYLSAGPLWSAMGNKLGFRTVGMIGSGIATIGYLGCYFISQEFFGLYVFVFVIVGIGSGMMYITTMIVVGFYFERWRGLATGLTSCGSGVGIIVVPLGYSAIASSEGYTWRRLLIFQSSLVLASGFLTILLKPIKPTNLAQRGERTVRFVDEPKGKKDIKGILRADRTSIQGGTSSSMTASSFTTLRQLHASQTSFSPSVAAPQFDAVSVISRMRPSDAMAPNAGTRPMYRDDIFYGASASRLSTHISSSRATMVSVSRPVLEHLDDEEEHGCCSCCPPAFARPLSTMFDLTMLSNVTFLVFTLSQVLAMVGFYTPIIYFQAQALEMGVSQSTSHLLLPALGVANSIGRALCGVLCELPGVDSLSVTAVAAAVAGMSSVASCLHGGAGFQIAMACVYGLCIAPLSAMKSLIIVDFFGLERLTNAFGLLLLFQGFAVMAGPPFSGWVKDYTHSYSYSFAVSGSVMILSAFVMLLMYPLAAHDRIIEQRHALRI